MARQKSHSAKTPSSSFNECHRILEDYLSALKIVWKSGAAVPETSCYPALSNLFNAVGKTLKPQVRCVMGLRNSGAGMPDGGLFTADQFRHQTDDAPQAGQLPARGAIEAKGTRPNVQEIAHSQQVKNYLKTYGIVLVTNLREFAIVERGPEGEPVERETFALARDEKDFRQHKVANPRGTAQLQGEPFVEFIRRACLHAAPLGNPKDVAWFLASYARDALYRVERQKELPALQAVREELEGALGMKFTDERGEHFFRSTLVQTLFYGVFSAWVRWHRDNPDPKSQFDWQKAEWFLHVPFIQTLYEELSKPSRLKPLGLVEVLDWAAGVLNRVDRAEFFSRFQDEHAVQYFYEPFLEAYDPELRKALGVWYTPPEIVKYQVARVDAVLREELNLPDGLADPNVIVLDPCCGTGAYLVEVLHLIAETLRSKGGDALVASDLKQAAMDRVFGFEIMPAPFVVAHLQLSSLLQNKGAPLTHSKAERVGVFLTNALTGWQPPKGSKESSLFPELEQERDAAEQVKRDKKILVVLGNPPYNAFAGVSPAEEEGLVEPYKVGLNQPVSKGGWGIRKFNLDDLYVRFFRLAERRIAEMSGEGVVSFISNFSYLDDPSFVVMRQRFLEEFDRFWFDCMNGDSRETGKLTPEGKPDPSVFSTPYNREGIRVGTAVCVIVRKRERQTEPIVRFRHFWGVTKRADLLASLTAKDFNQSYTVANPRPENRYSFRPETVAAHYTQWPRLVELCALPPSNGLMEKRGGALIDIDRDALAVRMRDYFDANLSWEKYKAKHTALTEEAAGFVPEEARSKALGSQESFDNDRLLRYALRPFDTRWCYYTALNPIWNRARPALRAQVWEGNRFLMSRPTGVATPEGVPFSLTSILGDNDYQRGHSYYFPLLLKNKQRLDQRSHKTLFDILEESEVRNDSPIANLSRPARAYLAKLGINDPDADTKTAGLIWMHALAIGYSPAYLTENADGIRRDWPRIPLPDSLQSLKASAALGEQVAALLDTEADVPGVTSGRIAPLFKTIGLITKAGNGAIDPSGDDLKITAGWGQRGKDGVVMPAKGKVSQRTYSADEQKALADEAQARGMTVQEVRRLLGEETLDVYLNKTAYWRNIPVNVWEYYIGGYQVIKKWLSYREHNILGRGLCSKEAREVTNMARRITAIILLQPRLDENYRNIKAAAFSWPPS